MALEVVIRILVATGMGLGVGLLLLLGWTPEPTPVKSTIFALLAYWWAVGGMTILDRMRTKKHDDDWWL